MVAVIVTDADVTDIRKHRRKGRWRDSVLQCFFAHMRFCGLNVKLVFFDCLEGRPNFHKKEAIADLPTTATVVALADHDDDYCNDDDDNNDYYYHYHHY